MCVSYSLKHIDIQGQIGLEIEKGVVTGGRGGGCIERCKLSSQNQSHDILFDMRHDIMRVLNAQVMCVCMYVCIFV